MRAHRWSLLLLAIGLSSGACGRLLMDPDPGVDPVTNFETLWEEFDRYYSFFGLKGIDWDGLYDEFRPQVTPSVTPNHLFNLMSDMLAHLKDGHVLLRGHEWTYQYRGWYADHPENFDFAVIRQNYVLDIDYRVGGALAFGRIGRLGYIHLSDFASEDLVEGFDEVLGVLQDVEGLIVDLRDNGGGSDSNSEAIAARFADRTRLYRRFQYRNGPDHDDFTPLVDDFITPRGPFQFSRPVAVLTNRGVFSAAESFVLAMRVFPHVTVLGATTGGGSGKPTQRELPNGWTFQLSRWIEWAPDGTTYEGVGLEPDIVVDITLIDQERGRDTILDWAVGLLLYFPP
ncbi:S41 family peptidase [Gemmatimonadota bacterium]